MIRISFLVFPLLLSAFEPQPVAQSPVIGFAKIPFMDHHLNMERELLVWYPVDPGAGKTPSRNPWDLFEISDAPPSNPAEKSVVVISHGYTSNPHQLSWLIRDLVANDFVVIGIQHLDRTGSVVQLNHWQRARDISAMIDQLAVSRFASAVNMGNIGIAGFSLGGTTAIWVSGGRSTQLDSVIPGPESVVNPEEFSVMEEGLASLDRKMMAKNWRDSRVKAAFVISPAWGWIFDSKSLHKISVPTYIIAPAEDGLLITDANAGFFAHHIPHSIFQIIPGKANHYVFITPVDADKRRQIDPTGYLSILFEDNSSVDRSWIQSRVSSEAARFFKSTFSK